MIEMWKQADKNEMELAPLTSCGWQLNQQTLCIKWDSSENIKVVNERIDALLKGCKCGTGCTTRRCKCLKQGKKCSVGCDCTNCGNTAYHQNTANELRDVVVDEELSSDVNDEVNDIVDWIFGEEILESDGPDSDLDNN